MSPPQEAVSVAAMNHGWGPCASSRELERAAAVCFPRLPTLPMWSVDSLVPVYLYILPVLHFSAALASDRLVQQGGVWAQISLRGPLGLWPLIRAQVRLNVTFLVKVVADTELGDREWRRRSQRAD